MVQRSSSALGELMHVARRLLMLGLGAVSLAAASLLAPHAIAAEKYPTRPVHFISGFPAGGAVDITARVMADWLSSDLGQQVIVENRGGMGGNLGVQAMLGAPADGYTIIL